MTRGRFKNGRYQQGIGIPETLSVQPTAWQEPKIAPLYQAKFDSPNAGVQRNYGSTPDYVDTWKSRWTVPQAGTYIKNVSEIVGGLTSVGMKAGKATATGGMPTTRPGEDPSVTARRGAWD